MFFYEAILALGLAVAFGLLLVAGLGVRGPWAAPWALFVVLFLLIWSGGVWLTPFGPAAHDVYWLPFVLLGLIVALLFAAFSEPRGGVRREPVGEAGSEERAAAIGFTIFFWLLVAALAMAIASAYL